MFVCITVLYEYMNSLRNEVNNLFDNKHMRFKIYREFYHGIMKDVMIKLTIKYVHNVVSSTPRLSGIRTHSVSGESTSKRFLPFCKIIHKQPNRSTIQRFPSNHEKHTITKLFSGDMTILKQKQQRKHTKNWK